MKHTRSDPVKEFQASTKCNYPMRDELTRHVLTNVQKAFLGFHPITKSLVFTIYIPELQKAEKHISQLPGPESHGQSLTHGDYME